MRRPRPISIPCARTPDAGWKPFAPAMRLLKAKVTGKPLSSQD